jgi:hypothetical protein
MASQPLEDLAARFTACTLPVEEWTHAAHLRVGAWHVQVYGVADALAHLRPGIRRLNESYGNANTATSGYHETITVAYVRLIDAFLDTFEPDVSLGVRAEALVSGPLAAKDLLLAYWSKPRLASTDARTRWTPPDLGPLVLPASLCRAPKLR